MNKARILLFTIAVVALTGGAAAFKAMRGCCPIFITTQVISANGTLYSTNNPGDVICWTGSWFFTTPPAGVLTPNILSTTGPATLKLTVRRVGGTPAQTITIANYCTVTTLTTTHITQIE